MRLVVYTALFGDQDYLWSVPPSLAERATYIVFTEKPRKEVGLWGSSLHSQYPTIIRGTWKDSPSTPTWQQRIVKATYGNQRSARYYKMMSHKVLPNADISIWVDANVRLLCLPRKAVKYWLGNGNLAAFNHPNRKCLYDEAAECLRRGKGCVERMTGQVQTYRKAGMPRDWGLAETKCVIRRNTPAITELNNAWWSEIQNFSARDQVSLPFVCWTQNKRWQVIPGRAGIPSFPGELNKAFWFIKHLRKRKRHA